MIEEIERLLGIERPQGPPLGYIKDHADSRDRLLGMLSLSKDLPVRASVASKHVKPRNQGASQSCVGFSVSTAMRLAMIQDGRDPGDLSPWFPYYNGRRRYTPRGSRVTDVGTFIREVMRSVIRVGIPAADLWSPPAGGSARQFTKFVNSQPDWMAYTYADQGRGARGYYRIPRGRPDEVRQALANGKPVVGGWRVDREFLNPLGEEYIDDVGPDIVGGHAMVIEGYEYDRFTLHNSWGRGYRRGGRVDVGEKFIAKGYDLWALDT